MSPLARLEKETPKDDLGGNGKPFFGGMPDQGDGLAVPGSQPVTLGLLGFGGAVICIQPLKGSTDAVAP